PAVLKYQGALSCSIKSAAEIVSTSQKAGKAALEQLVGEANALYDCIAKLEKAHAEAESKGSLPKKAEAYKDDVIPAMLAVRNVVDGLEAVVSDELWPLPKYREMLFQY